VFLPFRCLSGLQEIHCSTPVHELHKALVALLSYTIFTFSSFSSAAPGPSPPIEPKQCTRTSFLGVQTEQEQQRKAKIATHHGLGARALKGLHIVPNTSFEGGGMHTCLMIGVSGIVIKQRSLLSHQTGYHTSGKTPNNAGARKLVQEVI
jgi:hypothetical protein